jgi:plastocyanin
MMNDARLSKDSVRTETSLYERKSIFLTMKKMCLFISLLFIVPTASANLVEDNTTIITVDSTNLRFSPSDVTIEEGQTVRFFWSGQALPHNAVEQNGVFDSGEPERNVDYSFTFERGMNGTYEFVCEPHAALGMVGTITVTPLPPLEPPTNNSTTTTTTTSEDTPFLPTSFVLISVIAAALIIERRKLEFVEDRVLVEGEEHHR